MLKTGSGDEERACEARINEFFLSRLITETFLSGECGKTSPETKALGSRTISFILISNLLATVMKATLFSTFGGQALAVPLPLLCKVMTDL